MSENFTPEQLWQYADQAIAGFEQLRRAGVDDATARQQAAADVPRVRDLSIAEHAIDHYTELVDQGAGTVEARSSAAGRAAVSLERWYGADEQDDAEVVEAALADEATVAETEALPSESPWATAAMHWPPAGVGEREVVDARESGASALPEPDAGSWIARNLPAGVVDTTATMPRLDLRTAVDLVAADTRAEYDDPTLTDRAIVEMARNLRENEIDAVVENAETRAAYLTVLSAFSDDVEQVLATSREGIADTLANWGQVNGQEQLFAGELTLPDPSGTDTTLPPAPRAELDRADATAFWTEVGERYEALIADGVEATDAADRAWQDTSTERGVEPTSTVSNMDAAVYGPDHTDEDDEVDGAAPPDVRAGTDAVLDRIDAVLAEPEPVKQCGEAVRDAADAVQRVEDVGHSERLAQWQAEDLTTTHEDTVVLDCGGGR